MRKRVTDEKIRGLTLRKHSDAAPEKKNLESQTFPASWLLIGGAAEVNTGGTGWKETKFTILLQVDAARGWSGV